MGPSSGLSGSTLKKNHKPVPYTLFKDITPKGISYWAEIQGQAFASQGYLLLKELNWIFSNQVFERGLVFWWIANPPLKSRMAQKSESCLPTPAATPCWCHRGGEASSSWWGAWFPVALGLDSGWQLARGFRAAPHQMAAQGWPAHQNWQVP